MILSCMHQTSVFFQVCHSLVLRVWSFCFDSYPSWKVCNVYYHHWGWWYQRRGSVRSSGRCSYWFLHRWMVSGFCWDLPSHVCGMYVALNHMTDQISVVLVWNLGSANQIYHPCWIYPHFFPLLHRVQWHLLWEWHRRVPFQSLPRRWNLPKFKQCFQVWMHRPLHRHFLRWNDRMLSQALFELWYLQR